MYQMHTVGSVMQPLMQHKCNGRQHYFFIDGVKSSRIPVKNAPGLHFNTPVTLTWLKYYNYWSSYKFKCWDDSVKQKDINLRWTLPRKCITLKSRFDRNVVEKVTAAATLDANLCGFGSYWRGSNYYARHLDQVRHLFRLSKRNQLLATKLKTVTHLNLSVFRVKKSGVD